MRASAFSLLELVIVIAILAVVAAIAIARLGSFSEDARINAGVADLRQIDSAFRMYQAEFGAWPKDQNQGVYPPELADFLPLEIFLKGPVLGEYWDWNPSWGPIPPAISVVDDTPDIGLWTEFDLRFDDGDLNTGNVRRSNGKFLHYRIRP